jgi:hypothetical protein
MAEMEALVQNLLALDEEELETQLGLRTQSIEAGDSEVASLESLEEELPAPRGLGGENALELGRQIFSRVYAEAYELLCKPLGGDEETAKALDKALEENYAKAASILAPVLVSNFALAPAIATIVATLVIKKISKDLAGGICSTWAKSLEGAKG